MTTETQIVLDETEFTPAQIAQDISASHDSCALIARITSANNHSAENDASVQRNISHLRSCLTLKRIMDNATTADKIAFADAATLGEDWLG